MALHRQGQVKLPALPTMLTATTQSISTTGSISDEVMADADEPPDSNEQTPRNTSNFDKRNFLTQRQPSLLTQLIHTSESESQEEDSMFSGPQRAHSSASNWSACSLTSDGQHSPDRAGSPSPPLPVPQFRGLPPIFNAKPYDGPPAVLRVNSNEAIGPLQQATVANVDQTFEAGLGRKRCISFACGAKKQDEAKKSDVAQAPEAKPADTAAKRPCALRFVCPTRPFTENTTQAAESKQAEVKVQQSQEPKRTTTLKFACPTRDTPAVVIDKAEPAPKPVRLSSPPPKSMKLALSPKTGNKTHRGSDSTVRNDSPKSVRKVPSLVKARRLSNDEMEVDRNESTRFHEFASSDEEVDDWTQESTVYKSKITVNDTLSKDKKYAVADEDEEDDEEVLDDEDADEDIDMDDEDDDDDVAVEDDEDENEDEDDEAAIDSAGYSSDEGFDSDDENGFACSDNESDAGSDYAWWAPALAHSADPVEHIRPVQRRTSSASSIESLVRDNNATANIDMPKSRQSPARPSRRRSHRADLPRTPELPDSTDFVCGTLDEDRPLEEAYMIAMAQRRAAKRKQTPQDIDPTFPTSDPEMDEEDEEDEVQVEESDNHPFMHGHDMDLGDEEATPAPERLSRKLIPKKRSPSSSPTKQQRMRSPPPAKRAMHKSPAPAARRAMSPAKRAKSPAPQARPLKSPAPVAISRKSSAVNAGAAKAAVLKHQGLGQPMRPNVARVSSSLPRGGFDSARQSLNPSFDISDDLDAPRTRGAIDIVKGLERKRARRQQKLYEKYCRNKAKKPEVKKQLPPGKGCEKMKLVGEGLNAYRGKPIVGAPSQAPAITQTGTEPIYCPFNAVATDNVAADLEGMHILSI